MPSPHRRSRGFAYLPLLGLIAVCSLLWWQRDAILGSFGTFLDVGENPQKAEAAVVLAGGWRGERVLRAGQLARAGFVPLVLISGPMSSYGATECGPATAFALRQGFDAAWFQCIPSNANSTKEEAEAVVANLKQRGLKKVLIVSVASHLRRARRLYRQTAPEGLEMHFVAADPAGYKLRDWYQSREGRKDIFLEWTKVVTSPFGI
jgi:uncharacterized SAM-binding protein YcdF (DUF218 family)